MRLVLVRHGQSMANRNRLVTGDTADVLSPDGVEQMRRTSAMLQGLGMRFEQHFTSQWQRARQSADLVLPGAPFAVDPRLGETHAGAVACMALPDFLQTWPDFYADNTNRYPGGESHTDLNARVMQWLNDVREQCDGDVLAVTHAGPIACLLQHVLDIPMDRFPALKASNSSISIVEFPRDEVRGQLLTFSWLPETTASELIGS